MTRLCFDIYLPQTCGPWEFPVCSEHLFICFLVSKTSHKGNCPTFSLHDLVHSCSGTSTDHDFCMSLTPKHRPTEKRPQATFFVESFGTNVPRSALHLFHALQKDALGWPQNFQEADPVVVARVFHITISCDRSPPLFSFERVPRRLMHENPEMHVDETGQGQNTKYFTSHDPNHHIPI